MPPLNRSSSIDQNDHLQYADSLVEYFIPRKQHCDRVNTLLHAAQSWSEQLPRRQQEIRDGTFFTILESPDMDCFHLVYYVEDTAGRDVLMLSQHPLLVQSAAARAMLLSEWYHTNHFTVSFDICLPASSRSELERAFDILAPLLSACLISPVSGVITPRLHTHCGTSSNGATFASMVQWSRLFYDDVLSEGRYAGIRTLMSTAAPNPAQFDFMWDLSGDEVFKANKQAATKVLLALRKEAVRLAADANKNIDVRRHVYNWLVNEDLSAEAEDGLLEAKGEMCLMVGPSFQELGYYSATKLYV